MKFDKLGPPRHPTNRALTPWQQLAKEGMTSAQIENKLCIPKEDTPCIGCPPGTRRVSLEKTQATELNEGEQELSVLNQRNAIGSHPPESHFSRRG